MAGKKPAKPQSGKGTQVTLDPAIYGAQIKYIGMKGVSVTCPSCSTKVSRGMVREKAGVFYCSPRCASLS